MSKPDLPKRIGVLVPFTNTNLETDMARMCPSEARIHTARLGGYDVDEIPDADQMAGLGESDLEEPLRLIAGVRPDAILYGCTSATLTHGPAFDQKLAAEIREKTGALSITAAGALVEALTDLGIRNIAFASPYVGEINDQSIAFLADQGFETVGRADIGRALGNYGQGELTPDEIRPLGERANTVEAEAIVLSCTDMRSVETVTDLETKLGKPVVTSNQAMVYCALRALNLPATNAHPGQLFNALRSGR